MLKRLKQYVSQKITAKPIHTTGIKKTLYHPALWSLDRHSVALGVAIGLACCVLPIFQTILASLLAILIRGNLPIAALLTWINNPLTFLPITYCTYRLGNCMVHENNAKIAIQQFNWKYESILNQWSAFHQWLLHFSKPYFLGLIILAISLGLMGYFMVMIPWEKIFKPYKSL